MSYTLTIPIYLGAANTGLTLRAQPKDTAGVDVGAAITTGFYERGNGDYTWTGDLPDGHRGSVSFETSEGEYKAMAGIDGTEERVLVSLLDIGEALAGATLKLIAPSVMYQPGIDTTYIFSVGLQASDGTYLAADSVTLTASGYTSGDLSSRITLNGATDTNLVRFDYLMLLADLEETVTFVVTITSGSITRTATFNVNVVRSAQSVGLTPDRVNWLDVSLSSRAAPGDAMALTSDERDATAGVVDARLLDAGDATDLIAGIAARIGNTNVDQAVLVGQIRADLERTGGKLQLVQADAAGLRADYTTTRAAKLDNLDATVNSRAVAGDAMTLTSGERTTLGTAVWATTTRTLTGFGTLVADVATAVWSAVARTLTGATPPTGIGPYPVNQSGGIGAGDAVATLDLNNDGTFSTWTANELQFTRLGVGVAGLTVRAYRKTAWDVQTGSGLVAQATTDANGNWLVNLGSGDHVLVANSISDSFASVQVTIRVP